jgi:hypothetical protein
MNNIAAKIYTDCHSTNYTFLKPGADIVRDPLDDTVDTSKLDFRVPRTADDIVRGHVEDLPLSFFEIEVGDIESGKIWYQNKFPKLSDDFAYLLSRYNWGDLKYATKKSIRNDAKKIKKKTGKKPDFKGGYKKEVGHVVVRFG